MNATAQLSETAGEAAFRQLRQDIIFGHLPPRRKLRLEKLSQEYDASVTTLREVLARLASEGLIVFEAQKGFEVAPVSAADLQEIAELRSLLECHALALSFDAGDLEWEARVVGAHHKLSRMEKRMLSGDRSVTLDWKSYDREFHVALISACGSAELLAAHRRIFDRFLRYQMLLVMFRGDTAAAEHDSLLAAALQRDTAEAQTILGRHIGACIDYTVQKGLLGVGTA
ncbi:GntR family transcriptional regulator [Cereibacter changlensis JA139]|uniref:GntR family transcriptional regulator n=2 Tax=Cereibacter changlensis TaxID=402884 RepID=A0A2T4K034_9RHOB|nr:GntR family transcriptional regulator [Cereibacter changlensis]PTE23363.1 GntR family transcriptional regulator [Cereibacter changlensis JA139]PZX48584.1 DNA-binding GntR family transcriptional regulator [Cereibacter changlensis]